MHSQRQILLYFGTDKQVDISELARCIIESQVQTYKAMSLAVDSVDKLNQQMLREVNCHKRSKQLAEQLDHLVHHAHKHGVITSREAESVLHPVRVHLKSMQARIREMHFGYIRHPTASSDMMDAADKEDVRRADIESRVDFGSSKQGETSVKDAGVQSTDSSVMPWGEATGHWADEHNLSPDSAMVVGQSSTAAHGISTDHVGAHSSSSRDIFVGQSQDPLAIGKSDDALFVPIVPGPSIGLQDA